MTSQTLTYKKFPAKKRRFIGSDRIWIGPDHLLLVESTGVSEAYKRFFFKDIQAIELMKTRTWLYGLIFVASLLLLTLGLGVWSWQGRTQELVVLPVLIGLVLVYYLIRVAFKGPSCQCWIYSAVQKEKLKPVGSLKAGTRLLDVLVPEIEACQGQLPLEKSTGERLVAASGTGLKGHGPAPLKKISTVWHRVAFYFLMLYGIVLTLTLGYHPPGMIAGATILGLWVLLLSAVALARQAGSDLSRHIKTISIAALVVLVLGNLSGYIEYMWFVMINMEKWFGATHNQWEMIKQISTISYFDYPLLLGKEICLICLYFVLGATGVVFLWREEK